jgi:transposase
MANTKDREKALAQDLFILTDKTQKEIASAVGVSEKTMSNWVEAGNWGTLRAGRLSTNSTVVSNLKEVLKQRSEQMLDEIRTGGTTKFGDELSKISKVIEQLEGEMGIGTYIQVLQEFMGFVGNKDHKFRGQLAEYQAKFLNQKAGTNV